jgi:four helix bundle protein
MKYLTFQEVPVWQLAHKGTLIVYRVSSGFPKEEIYGLTSQIRRSSSSIPANIAEGFCRNTTKELIMFLYTARGSCSETIYHLILAKDLGYLDKTKFDNCLEIYNDLSRQLNNWINSLKRKISK